MEAPLISILIAVYNTEAFLPQCLDSIKAQSFASFEAICIDDGSTDGSAAILDAYAASDSRFLVHHQSSHGVGYTKNLAISLANGKFILFIDSDDFIEPDTLLVVSERAEQTQAQIVGFPYNLYFDDINLYTRSLEGVDKKFLPVAATFSADNIPETLFQTMTPSVCNKLWQRAFLVENGIHFGDFQYAEDYFLVYWAMAIAPKITVCTKKAYYHYRQRRAGSLTSVSDDEPLTFMEAYCSLREKLEEIGKYEFHMRSYLNLTLAGIHYEFSKLKTIEGRALVADYLRREGFAQLGVEDFGRPYYYNKEFYITYREILEPSGAIVLLIRRALMVPRSTIRYLRKFGLKETVRRIFHGKLD